MSPWKGDKARRAKLEGCLQLTTSLQAELQEAASTSAGLSQNWSTESPPCSPRSQRPSRTEHEPTSRHNCGGPSLPPAPAPPDQRASAPSGHGYARRSPRPVARQHSQLRQVLYARQVAEAIQGPNPGAAQPRGAVGAADIRAGCGARRCQHQPGQQAAQARSPAVPAKRPALAASQHRGDARLAPPGCCLCAPAAAAGPPATRARGGVKEPVTRKGRSHRPPPGPAPSGNHASSTPPKPPTRPPPLWGGPAPSFSPKMTPSYRRRGGASAERLGGVRWGGGAGKLIRCFFQPKAAAFRGEGR